MQPNLAILSKRSISAALKGEWEKAIELNQQILSKYKDNQDTKIRLGRAYIQTKNFSQAKKIFKEVLQKDPINNIAKRNLEIANKGIVDKVNNDVSTKSLLKEPGTTEEFCFKALNKPELTPGQELEMKISKTKVKFLENKTLVMEIEGKDVVTRLNNAKAKKASLKACFIKYKDEQICVIIKSSIPIFKSERQDVRPYMKKDSFDEPELETGVEDTEE